MIIEIYVMSTADDGNLGVYQFFKDAYKDAENIFAMSGGQPHASLEQASLIMKDNNSVELWHMEEEHGKTRIRVEKFPLALSDVRGG